MLICTGEIKRLSHATIKSLILIDDFQYRLSQVVDLKQHDYRSNVDVRCIDHKGGGDCVSDDGWGAGGGRSHFT